MSFPLPLRYPTYTRPDVGDLLGTILGVGVAASIAPLIAAYFQYLEYQAKDKRQSLPTHLIDALRPHYTFPLESVRYSVNIDTVHGQAITVDDSIYFPIEVDFSDCDYIHWLCHELEHCSQYRAHNGKVGFLAKYANQVGQSILRNASLNVHDLLGLEREAEAKANAIYRGVSDAVGARCDRPIVPRVDPWKSLYIVQNQRLHRVNPHTGDFVVIGQDWGGWTASAAFSGGIYIIQNRRIHLVNPADGTYRVVPGEWGEWNDSPRMTTLMGFVYLVLQGRLYRIHPTTGTWDQLNGDWGGHSAIGALGSSLYIVQNRRLHRVDPESGDFAVLSEGWAGPAHITDFGDSLYIIQNKRLHRVSPVDGSYIDFPGDWSFASSMTKFLDCIYIIQNSRLHRVNPANGDYSVLAGDWGGMTSLSGWRSDAH